MHRQVVFPIASGCKFQAAKRRHGVSRAVAIAAVVLAAGGCSVETATFSGPITVRIIDHDSVVIRALNPPHACRLVAADAVFPMIYETVAGPMPEDEAAAWMAAQARAPGGACRRGR